MPSVTEPHVGDHVMEILSAIPAGLLPQPASRILPADTLLVMHP